MPLLELPHWLMIAGALLVLAGLVGLAFGRKKEAEAKVEPEVLPGDVDSWRDDQPRSPPGHGRSAA